MSTTTITETKRENPSTFLYRYDVDSYEHAVELVEAKLYKMGRVQARFSLTIGSGNPELIIDARDPSSPAKLSVRGDKDDEESVDAKLTVEPKVMQTFADGIIDGRYAVRKSHLTYEGPVRVPVKFVDAMSKYDITHPTLDKSKLHLLPKPTEDIALAKQNLREWGYCLVKNALTPDEVQKLRKRLLDQAKGEADAGIGAFDGGEGKPNQRVWSLVNKGQEFVDLLDTNFVLDTFLPEVLGAAAALASLTGNIARYGGEPMVLHTDQNSVQPIIREYPLGMNFGFFLGDVTAANGGTLVMPGTHLGTKAPNDPWDTRDTVAAEGPAGTALIFESRLWHATGPNVEKGSERPVLLAFFMREFVRPQENFSLSLRPDVFDKLSDKVKGYLGFRVMHTRGSVQDARDDWAIVKKPTKWPGVLGGESVPLH